MTSKARAAGLIASLVLLSLLLGSLSANDSAPLSQVVRSLQYLKQSPPPPPPPPPTGYIVVNASVIRASSAASPVADATVTIQSAEQDIAPLVLPTNSSGEVEVQEDVGNWSVAVSTQSFSYLALVEVSDKVTTVANFIFTEAADQTVYLDLSNADASGYVAPWQSVIMAVNDSSAVTNGSDYFIDAYNVMATTTPPGEVYTSGAVGYGAFLVQEVPVTIVSSSVTGSGNSSLLWLTMHPAQFLYASGDLLYIVGTYVGSVRITYLGY